MLFAYGGGLVLYTLGRYDLGTFSYMGPGMFPVLVGSVLMGLAVLIVIPAVRTPGTEFHVEWRPLIAVLGTIAAFALMIDSFGLVPAILVMTVIAGFASERLSMRSTALLAVVIAVLTVGLFHFALKLRFEIFAWPF